MDVLTQHQLLWYTALTLGFGFLLVRLAIRAYTGPAAAVPGPWFTRWTSLPFKYYSLRALRTQWVHSLHERYGPVVRLKPDEVSISDVRAVREIHRISTPFRKTDYYRKLAGKNTPPGLFTFSDPKEHSARRRLLASPLSESSLKNVEPTVNKNIDKAIEGIGREMKEEGSADIFKWFTFMATDVIGELSFAESFRMLDQGKPNQYSHDLQAVALGTALRSELGAVTYALGALGVKPFNQAFGATGRFREYSQQSFKRYEQHVAMNPTNPKPTLFTKFIQKVEGEEALPRESLIREGQGYIVAGSDTTAFTTTYLVYALTRHRDIKERLVAELSTLPSNFGWEDVRKLPYLNKCIEEALRLYGAAPSGLPRWVPQGGAHLAGYTFPENFVVSTQAYTLHRDPSIWPEPEKFNPDRWDNPTQQMHQAYMPFGAGTRICIGLHLARDEMRMAVARFFLTFPHARVTSSDDDMEFRAYFLATLKRKKCMCAAS